MQIRTMCPDDFAALVALTDKEQWHYRVPDFEEMHRLEPEGCFVGVDGDCIVALATTISYGEVGYIGNVVIEKKMRRKGLGQRIMERAGGYLKGTGVSTVRLYSYQHSVKFYEALGFSRDANVLLYLSPEGAATESNVAKETTRVTSPTTPSNASSIYRFDCDCFGANRSRRLEPSITSPTGRGFVTSASDNIDGYILFSPSSHGVELGPCVCVDSEAFKELIGAVLSIASGPAIIAVPAENTAAQGVLEKMGFSQKGFITGMHTGRDWYPRRPEYIYGIGSLFHD